MTEQAMLVQVERQLVSPTLPPVPNKPKTKGRPFRIPDELYDTAKALAEADPKHRNLSSVVRAKLAEYVAERTKRK